jgi:hypothetical protein
MQAQLRIRPSGHGSMRGSLPPPGCLSQKSGAHGGTGSSLGLETVLSHGMQQRGEQRKDGWLSSGPTH